MPAKVSFLAPLRTYTFGHQESLATVRYAALEFGGFLGMDTDRYPPPRNVLKRDTSKESHAVPLDKDRLDMVPRYHQRSVPQCPNFFALAKFQPPSLSLICR